MSGAFDAESQEWVRSLTEDATRDEAVLRLHALLLRASRYEVERRRAGIMLGVAELDEVARAAAEAALTKVLGCLEEYRGVSRFTTWSSKFALLEAAVRLRRLGWQSESAAELARLDRERLLARELQSILGPAIAQVLTPSERHVFEALGFNGVPIDVLADQLQATRSEVYDTLRRARRAIRQHFGSVPTAVD